MILCLAMVLTMFNGVVFATETTEADACCELWRRIDRGRYHPPDGERSRGHRLYFGSELGHSRLSYRRRGPKDIQDETLLEEDPLVPTYRFGNLTRGTYEFTLTISEMKIMRPVYQKTLYAGRQGCGTKDRPMGTPKIMFPEAYRCQEFLCQRQQRHHRGRKRENHCQAAGCPDIVLSGFEASWFMPAV